MDYIYDEIGLRRDYMAYFSKDGKSALLYDGGGFITDYETMKAFAERLNYYLSNTTKEKHDKGRYEAIIESLKPKPHTRAVKEKKHKPGVVYFIGDDRGNCKIGISRQFKSRVNYYLKQPYNPNIHRTIDVSDVTAAEKVFHEMFKSSRVNGEWFALDEKDIAFIKSDECLNMLREKGLLAA
jgi:hypothetical protein